MTYFAENVDIENNTPEEIGTSAVLGYFLNKHGDAADDVDFKDAIRTEAERITKHLIASEVLPHTIRQYEDVQELLPGTVVYDSDGYIMVRTPQENIWVAAGTHGGSYRNGDVALPAIVLATFPEISIPE